VTIFGRGAGRLRCVALGSAVALAVAGCASDASSPVQPIRAPLTAAPLGPTRTASPAVIPTRAALVAALADRQLVLSDAQRAFRPIEAPGLNDTSRAVYQVLLPDDPDRGFIAVYELPDETRAVQAAQDQAAYLASGPGRIQAPSGTIHVIRAFGPTMILYSWHPEAGRDPSEPAIQDALESIGTGVPVPG